MKIKLNLIPNWTITNSTQKNTIFRVDYYHYVKTGFLKDDILACVRRKFEDFQSNLGWNLIL
jgi:hypothetical protein